MRRIMIVVAILLTGISIFIFDYIQAKKTTPDVNIFQGDASFEISDWGTLKSVRKGREEIFGKGKPTNEAYNIAYQVIDPRTGRPKKGEQQKQIYAGPHYPLDLAYCPTCSKRNKPNQSVASMISKDGTLMVTSSFELDPRSESLIVFRRIRNISNEPEVSKRNVEIKLVSVQVQYDSRLDSDATASFGLIGTDNTKKKITSTVKPNNLFPKFDFLTNASLVIPCEWCDPNPCITLTYDVKASEEGIICVDCRGDIPGDPRMRVQLKVPEASCKHPIKVVEWNGGPINNAGGQVGIRPGESKLVCIKCPSTSNSDVTVTSFPAFGLSASSISQREHCDAVVPVSRGQDKFSGLLGNADQNKVAVKLSGSSIFKKSFVGQSNSSNDLPKLSSRPSNLSEKPLKPGEEAAFWVVYSLKR